MTVVNDNATAAPTPTPLLGLVPVLKQLRLSGLLDSLEVRNREAIANKLSYPEFLALVIQDEAARRDQKKYGLRLRRSGFRGDKTLEGFDFDFNASVNQALVRELASCAFVAERVAVSDRRAVRHGQEPHRPGDRARGGAPRHRRRCSAPRPSCCAS